MILKPTEARIYELLTDRELYRNEKGIFAMYPRKLLIKLSGKGERTVQYALTNLEKQGYIRRELIHEKHLMLYYLLKEDFSGRLIHDGYKIAET